MTHQALEIILSNQLKQQSFENPSLIHHGLSVHGALSCTAVAKLVLMDFMGCRSWAV